MLTSDLVNTLLRIGRALHVQEAEQLLDAGKHYFKR
jgi:hypothetical protein